MSGKDTPLIHAKVAQILSDRELAINRGRAHGVDVGMKFKIFNRSPESIKDPETGEEIASVRRVNVVVEVVQVDERASVARTFRTRDVNLGGNLSLGNFEKMFAAPKWEKRVETLGRDPKRSAGRSVQIGDVAEEAPDATADWDSSFE